MSHKMDRPEYLPTLENDPRVYGRPDVTDANYLQVVNELAAKKLAENEITFDKVNNKDGSFSFC